MSDGRPEQADQPDEADHRDEQGFTYGRVRRAPRYGPFMATGALVGLVVALVLTIIGRSGGHRTTTFVGGLAPDYSAVQVFLYVALFLGAAGVAVGAVVALVIERRR